MILNPRKFFALTVLLLTACMPRGETISLDQSLKLARDRYNVAIAVHQKQIPAELDNSLQGITASLERLATVSSDSLFREESKNLALSLKSLVLKAGYTSRPAIDEISNQFELFSAQDSSAQIQPGTARLLAQRTYHLLAAEIETTRFAL